MTSTCWLAVILTNLVSFADPGTKLYSTRSADIKFFSEAPIENIEGVSKQGYGIINTDSGEIQFGVMIRSFQFRKSLMKEHFNENYMESDKFPQARFKGRISTPIDLTENAVYEVVATGELFIHGISKNRTIKGKIKVINGKLEIMSEFQVECKDHQIEIPRLVYKNIAETIKITLKGTFSTT